MTTSRRDFLRASCTTAILLALGFDLTACDAADPTGSGGNGNDTGGDTGITVSGSIVTLDLTGTRAKAVANVGGVLFIEAVHVVVINVDGTTIRAFTSICTHEGCDVSSFEGSRLRCPCHGAEFDTSGQVTRGPATRPLREYDVARDGDVVTITVA